MNRIFLPLIILLLIAGNLSCDRNRYRAKFHTDDLARTWLWTGATAYWERGHGTTYATVTDTPIAIAKLDDRSFEFLGKKFRAQYKVGSGLDQGEVRYQWSDISDRAEIQYFYKKDSVVYRYLNSRSSYSEEIVLTGR